MKKLLAILLLELPLVACAADYQQSLGVALIDYYVTGKQADHVRFVVPGGRTQMVRVAVVGGKRIVGCSTRYCRSPGTQQAIVDSVVLRAATSTSAIPFANGDVLALAPGSYVLEIVATGIGTGQYSGNGPYSVNLFKVAMPPSVSDDD